MSNFVFGFTTFNQTLHGLKNVAGYKGVAIMATS